AAFAAIYIIWGSTFLGIRIAIDTIPPFLMGGLRFLLGGAVQDDVSRERGAAPTRRAHLRSAAHIGALPLPAPHGGRTLVGRAAHRVRSGRAARRDRADLDRRAGLAATGRHASRRAGDRRPAAWLCGDLAARRAGEPGRR